MDLHPNNPHLTPTPPHSPEHQFELAVLTRHVKALKDVAPGPSRWSASMVKALLVDSACLEGLRFLVEHIINDDLPRNVRDRICSARLIPLSKPNGGIRPIAIGETFLKLASGIIFSTIKPQFPDLFGEHTILSRYPRRCRSCFALRSNPV